jgi:hypothetical protein
MATVISEKLKKLRRRIEDFLRKNPSWIEPVAKFLKLKTEDDEEKPKSNNKT